ncbi:MAG: cardiolipin synthase, partial [Lachnospiraceae bacterium]|nr:cardiolipin synthase [Lachnospiraceae bacterium]
NHQKIVVIDGNIGYTGGFNLADEYVNAIERFGYWKDGGVRIEGPAVWGLTTVFLGMWDMTVHDMEADVDRFRPKERTLAFDTEYKDSRDCADEATTWTGCGGDAFCQIISDGPENNPDNPILDMITQLFCQSQEYLYISTPYLVLEDKLGDALIQAAKSGVDVRIVTPGIPDKKVVNQLTKYNYGRLLEGGVRVFEYTPGFIHIKNIVTKGCSLIGTINLDYRSLFLHYECGAVIWDEELNRAAKEDMEKTFGVSREITLEMWKNRPTREKIRQWFLNIFSSEV